MVDHHILDQRDAVFFQVPSQAFEFLEASPARVQSSKIRGPVTVVSGQAGIRIKVLVEHRRRNPQGIHT